MSDYRWTCTMCRKHEDDDGVSDNPRPCTSCNRNMLFVKRCLICQEWVLFTPERWARRHRRGPLDRQNCQPRCITCDNRYRRFRSRLERAKRTAVDLRINPDRLRRGDPYYRSIKFNASRLSAKSERLILEILANLFPSYETMRPTFLINRETTAAHEEYSQIDLENCSARPAL